ncbi:phosphatase domain-containing protein [Myxosarcina sp. GI1(2024)]
MSVRVPYPDYVWWLIPEKLAGISRPSLEDLPQLYQAGMRGIVSVMDELSGIEEYKQAGFKALWLPITGGKPPTVEQVKQFLVVMHCNGNLKVETF